MTTVQRMPYSLYAMGCCPFGWQFVIRSGANGSTAAPILGFGTQNTAPFGFQYPAFIPKTLDAKGGIVGSQISIGGSDQNLKPETTLVYSGGIERQLGRNMVASVTYVGTHSYNLWTGGVNPNSTNFGQDINVVAGDLINHLVCKGAVGAQTCTGVTTRPNTSFGSITYTLNAARQNYNALIVAVKGRLRSGASSLPPTPGRPIKTMRSTIPPRTLIATMGRRSMTRHSGSPWGPAISSRGSTTTMDLWGG